MEKNIFWNEIDTSDVHSNYTRTSFFKTYNKIINWVDKLQEMEQEWVSIIITTYDLKNHLIYMKKEDIVKTFNSSVDKIDEKKIDEVIVEHEDEIVNKSVDRLVTLISKRKAMKDKYGSLLDGE